MKFFNKIIFVLSALLFTTAIFAERGSPNTSVYTEDKLGISVTADKPQFIIKLHSNPSTGYSWFLREYDDKIIVPVKHSYEAAKNKLVGAPGVDVWTFRVKASAFTVPQQTVIRFVYARPWEGGDQSKQIAFRVTTSGR